MQFVAQSGGSADITTGETAGFLLFFVGLIMAPVVAIITNSLSRGKEPQEVRIAQYGVIGLFLVTALSLLFIFAVEPSESVSDPLFTLSGFTTIAFMIVVVMLLVHGVAEYTRDNLLNDKKGKKHAKVRTAKRKAHSKKR